MELFTKTLLFFNIAFIVLYLLGWVAAIVSYCKLTPVQRRYINAEISVPGMLGFISAVCYIVAYWMV